MRRRFCAYEIKGYAGKMAAERVGMMQEMMPARDALAYRHLQAVSPVDFGQAYASGAVRLTRRG